MSQIAPQLAQASSQEHKFRLSVVANEMRLLIFSTALSETPEFLRRVLLKIQIIRDMMLCQRARTDDRYFLHLQDDAVQEEPLRDHERERIKDRSKRRK